MRRAGKSSSPLGLLWGAVFFAASFSACSGASDSIVVAVAILPSELPTYRAAMTEFERRSGHEVVIVPQQYADIRRALAAEMTAGSGTLDIVELDIYALSSAARAVAPLPEDALAQELAAMTPNAVRAGRIDGLRFLPHRLGWQALIYNRAVLGSPPKTWDDLLAVARAHPGQIGLKGALYEGLTCDVLPFVWSAGGSGTDLDDEGALEALRFLGSLAPYLHPQSAVFKEASIVEAMARGEIVLHLNWPFAISVYTSQGLSPGTIQSAPIPAGPRGSASVLGGGYVAIPRSAPHPEAALELIRYLVGREAQTLFARELGWFSARNDVEMQGDVEAMSGFAAMRALARPRPEIANYPRLSRLWQGTARAVLFEGADPASAARRAEATWREQEGS